MLKIIEAIRLILYHATSRDLGLQVNDFILPPVETKNLRESQRKKNLDVVFLTNSLHSAKMYAKKVQNSVIFECKVSERDWIGRTHISNEFIAYRAEILREL